MSQRKSQGCNSSTLDQKELQTLARSAANGEAQEIKGFVFDRGRDGTTFLVITAAISQSISTPTPRGVPLLSIISQKTHMPTKVPLNLFPWLTPVLEEYDYTSPTTYNQKLNADIKEITKLAGITNRVLVWSVSSWAEKHALENPTPKSGNIVCTHTCRRSFCYQLIPHGLFLRANHAR